MKKTVKLLSILFLIILIFIGCNKVNEILYEKYTDSFFDTFDTMTVVVGYTKSEEEFNSYMEKIHSRFQELHKLYDIYNNYEGINNIKTINDNAGIKPVKVSKDIIDIIVFSKEWYKLTKGKVNIAMGSVLSIWHDYREEGIDNPENARLPPMKELLGASKYTDIDKVIVDTKNNTVYLEDKRMSLDIGAVAKGYATEIVAKEIMNKGFKSGIISAGGNVRVLGKPLDGIRKRWGIGIQDPKKSIVSDKNKNIDTIFLNNASVVSSGDYQRYYVVDDKKIHHLIDPKTLMPGEYYRAVTVIAKDSGLADLLSTAVYLMPYNQSRQLVESLEGVEAIWVMADGNIEATKGMKKIMKSNGASGAKSN
ncbi:FAD:protein FMN transferase [Clostridium tetani]|uniref:FAD:protein FMN transferase n=1 Tax=Clostridium tetani TaxID=1513 RepID=A0A4Q0VFS5_CLOTA|nr:FAD:protein FMN transferase [Clostridium tetani]RXI49895.1 FAD:protein FMN transferase [Clostridium tetani]BDR67601.1 FAD:protein FMN transferase [Clostridium tetani]BDR72991.1 FAD:protein FMN transferase [Clostridium tetani]BDR81534.1 FAD:protein FMN transferase [Clostridium tetani]BDR89915.1 FAD:protein FMN transferase [Clostridium tetani]